MEHGITGACVVQMHDQAKSSAASLVEKVQAGKKQEQDLVAAHQALKEANRRLQVCLAPWNSVLKILRLLLFVHYSTGIRLLHEEQCTSAASTLKPLTT